MQSERLAEPASRLSSCPPRDPFLDEVLAMLPALRAYATGLTGSLHDADDLLQDTLVKVIRFRGGFQPGTNLRAWVYSIVRNSFLTSIRRRGWMVQDTDGKFSQLLAAPDAPDLALEYRETLAALQQLPAERRDALMLITGGWSYEEAAEVCGCPPGTVKSRVNRAKADLLQVLETGAAARGKPGRPPRAATVDRVTRSTAE